MHSTLLLKLSNNAKNDNFPTSPRGMGLMGATLRFQMGTLIFNCTHRWSEKKKFDLLSIIFIADSAIIDNVKEKWV